MASCKACRLMDIACNGCIFDEHFSKPDEIQDLKKLIREFSYDGLKVRLRQVISEEKSVSVFVSDVIKMFDGINTKVPSGCVCSDNSAISKIVDCSSCVLGRVFTHPDQSGCLEMLVKHFSSIAIFKRYLEVMEYTHGIEFVKFYVKAMYHEIIQVNSRIEFLQDDYESDQRAVVTFEEKITSLKEQCIHYKNECNKLIGYKTVDEVPDAEKLFESLELEKRLSETAPQSVAPQTVPPGSGSFRVVRAPGTTSGGMSASAAGGPSSVGPLSVAPAAEVSAQQSTRSRLPRTRGRVVHLDAVQEKANAAIVYVSSASEKDSDSDPDYDPEDSN